MDTVGYGYPDCLWNDRTGFEPRLCPMYDLYGDLVVIPRRTDLATVRDLLSRGLRSIYQRSAVEDRYRRTQLEWVSPYKEKPSSSMFLHKENNYKFFGNLRKVYYNPRYANQRLLLKGFFKLHPFKSMGVIGSGIGPFPVTLSSQFQVVTCYEVNPWARYYARINLDLNSVKNVKVRPLHEGETYQVLIVVRPTAQIQPFLPYFKEVLLFYQLLKDEQVEHYTARLGRLLNSEVDRRVVRNYSKDQKIYRFFTSKTLLPSFQRYLLEL